MENQPGLMPAIAVKSIATGMCMMAAFTLIWAGIAFGSIYPSTMGYALMIFPMFSILFIVNAIRLFAIAKYFPGLTSEADIAEGKRTGKWFGIIFGAEGLGIFIGVNIVTNIGHADLTIPVIALVVGLHFYPLAKVFKRTVDYYLATWSTLVAIIGIILILKNVYPVANVDAFVGIGLAVSTVCYGTYMMLTGRKINKQLVGNSVSV